MGIPAEAGYTPPGDEYQLFLANGFDVLSADSVCFADGSAYFRKLPEGAPNTLRLDKIRSIERYAYREKWKGFAIGGGLVLGGLLASYYLGGGNHTSAFIDRRGLHILAGLIFMPSAAMLGGLVGEVLGARTLFDSRDPERHLPRRQALGCGDTLGGNSPPIAAGRYPDLDREVGKQAREGSAAFADRKKNRLGLWSGLLFEPGGEGPARGRFGATYTRMLLAHKGSSYGARLGFSAADRIEAAGGRYRLDLLAEMRTPLTARIPGHMGFGFRLPLPDGNVRENDFPALWTEAVLGLSWQAGPWLLFAEGELLAMETLGARAGIGFEF